MPTENLTASLRSKAPSHYTSLQEYWTNYRIKRITKSIVKRYGLVVQKGPFAGMIYVPRAVGSSLLPKLLGSYEAELHDIVAEIIKLQLQLDYRCRLRRRLLRRRLSLRLPQARVFAFDIDAHGRQLCDEWPMPMV